MTRPQSRSLSSFRDLVTLRLRHSWTSWRRNLTTARRRRQEIRLLRRQVREQRRLDRALTLVAEQQGRLLLAQRALEQHQHPLLEVPQHQGPGMQPLIDQQALQRAFNPSPGLTLVPQQEPTADDLLLGLHRPPTSSPSSES